MAKPATASQKICFLLPAASTFLPKINYFYAGWGYLFTILAPSNNGINDASHVMRKLN